MKEEIKISVDCPPAIKNITADLPEHKKPNKRSSKQKWIEVIPHGLVEGMIPHLCLMVFKEKEGSKRFAVSLSHLQGRMAMHQGMQKEEPFRFISDLLSGMKVKLEKCYFLKCDKGHILTRVILSGHPSLHSMDLNADDVIPFAVYSSCKFYCTENFITEMLAQKVEHSLRKAFMKKPLYLN